MAAAPPAAIVILARQPRSINAQSLQKFQSDVAAEARVAVQSPLTGARLYSKVYYFHRGATTIDADDMSKPVLDALQGVVYQDDHQVVLRMAAKIDMDIDSYDLTPHPGSTAQYARLLELLQQEQHVLYIDIGELADLRLIVGASP